MARFEYEALDKGGRAVRGEVEAADAEGTIEKLRNLGYFATRVDPAAPKAADMDILALPGLRLFFHRVRPRDVMVFTRQFAALMEAGVPLIRSLHVLQSQMRSPVFKEKIGAMIATIEEGGTLSEALSHHPRQFPLLYVAMIRAGEMGGALETVLERLAEHLERSESLKHKVRSAMMYPATVVSIALTVVAFILVKILPRFQAIFRELGAELPWLTQQLFNLSYLVMYRAPWLVLGATVVWMVYRQIVATKEGRYVADRLHLKLPVIGDLLRSVAVARFASTLATLIRAGVPILQALDIVRDTAGNEVVARGLDEVYKSVKDGDSINEPMARHAVFPAVLVQMVAIGEETGSIDVLLEKIATIYQRETEETITGLTALLEPILILFLGIVIGGVVVALYLPMFTIGGPLK